MTTRDENHLPTCPWSQSASFRTNHRAQAPFPLDTRSRMDSTRDKINLGELVTTFMFRIRRVCNKSAIPPVRSEQRGFRLSFWPRFYEISLPVLMLPLMSACSDIAPKVSSSEISDPPAADRALREFGEKHPSCPMWTNWQRLCSRTGSGDVACTTDPGRRVAPSEPFCAGYLRASPYYRHNPAQERSYLRFCSGSRVESLVDGAGNRSSGRRLCRRFAADRPFNGHRPAARENSLCEVWSSEETGKAVCAAPGTSNAALPTCSEHPDPINPRDGLLYCSQWRSRNCRPFDGMRRTAVEEPRERIIVIPDSYSRDSIAVFGVMCTNREG